MNSSNTKPDRSLLTIKMTTRERAAINAAAERAGYTQQAFAAITLLRAAGRTDLAGVIAYDPKQVRMQAELEEKGAPKSRKLPRGDDLSPITIRLTDEEFVAVDEAARAAGFGERRRMFWLLSVLLEATELADELQTAATAAEQLRQYKLALSRVRAA